jgi:hypothetical protein
VRSDGGTARPDATSVLRGAAAAARGTLAIAQPSAPKLPVLVNWAAGVVIAVDGRPFAVLGFTVSGGKIVEVDAILDPDRIALLNLAAVLD